MLWDTPEVPLPGDLLILWNRAKLGQKKLDLKSFLEQLPLWAEIPARAPDNNHRQDGKNVRDKMYKFWSQTILHLLRSQAVLHSVLKDWAGIDEENGEIVVLSQQHYQLMCELYHRILEERKRSSIPGSVIKEDNVLFQKEDITNEQNQLKINRAGSSSFKGFGGLKGGFRPGGFRFRGGGFKGNYSFRGQSGTVFKGKGGFKGRGKGNSFSANCLSFNDSTSQRARSARVPKACSAKVPKARSANIPKASSAILSRLCKPKCYQSLLKFEKGFMLVERTFTPRGFQNNPIWNSTTMGITPCVVKDNYEKVRFRGGKGKQHFDRVSKGWCSKNVWGLGKYRAFSPLVCSVKDRKQQRKTQINLRLQRIESILSYKNF